MAHNSKNTGNNLSKTTDNTATAGLAKDNKRKDSDYTPPKIEKLGSLEHLTQSSGSGM